MTLVSKLNVYQGRFIAATAISFLIAPVIGHTVAVLFGIIDPQTIKLAATRGYLPALATGLLLLLLVYYLRTIVPVFDWIRAHPDGENMPDPLAKPLQNFSTTYWAFYLAYVLVIPQAYFWVSSPAIADPLTQYAYFTLLQMATCILVGLPAFLYAMDIIGRLVAHVGLPYVQFGLRLRLMLLGGFVPLLSHAVMLKYYWDQTGILSSDTVIILLGLGVVIAAITLLSVKSINQALRPVKDLLDAKGATSYVNLEQLKPQSTDEIGYLTQTLSRLFSRLNAQEANKRAIVDTAAEAIISMSESAFIKSINPTGERMFGYKAHELIDKPLSILFPNIHSAADVEALLRKDREFSAKHKKGNTIIISARFSEMVLSGKRMFTCMAADITEKKVSEIKRRKAESRYQDLVEMAHDLVWSTDPKGNWTYLNKASANIYGLTPKEMMGMNFCDFSAPEYSKNDIKAITEINKGRELVQYETVHIDQNGTRHHISFNARAHIDTKGNIVRISGTARDITKQKSYEQQLAYQAQHDSLTGLYNRSYFDEELERLISRVARSGSICALFYIDLDQFKYINDTLGHAAGDRLLLEVTKMLDSNKREGDLLARFGGDEFTLILYNVMGRKNALKAAEHVRRMFEAYKFHDQGRSFNITCSIGVSMIDNDTNSKDEVMAQADLACNIAKNQGRNRIHLYDPSDDVHINMAEDMGWASRVREVLEKDMFMLNYQPIISMIDGRIYDYEVLLRMPIEGGKLIMPGGFLPVAERFGLIHNIDRWTVNKAIRNLSDLRKNGHDIRFNINLSGRAFEDDQLLPLIRKALAETSLDPSMLTFEITETAAITNLNAASQFILNLREIGCQFALDDFGSGFCSFTYLKNLPVDKLKIDGSFVKGLSDAPIDQAMVRSMNQVAHALEKKTIAESVEDAATLRLLKNFGVDYAQGHFIGYPSNDVLTKEVVALH